MNTRIITISVLIAGYLAHVAACIDGSGANNTSKISRVDTAIYTVLPYDSTAMLAMSWYYKDARPATLTPAEVDSLEHIVDSAYRSFTKDSTVYLHNLMPLGAYRRQYVAVLTTNGEKEVWVNFLCADLNGDWRHFALSVDDGGKCFFELFINVTRQRAYKLIPGGYA